MWGSNALTFSLQGKVLSDSFRDWKPYKGNSYPENLILFPFSAKSGEGNGNPLQCSCLENPRDGGAWWAAVYGVAESWTWLKRLSSSSSAKGSTTHRGSIKMLCNIPPYFHPFIFYWYYLHKIECIDHRSSIWWILTAVWASRVMLLPPLLSRISRVRLSATP